MLAIISIVVDGLSFFFSKNLFFLGASSVSLAVCSPKSSAASVASERLLAVVGCPCRKAALSVDRASAADPDSDFCAEAAG